MFTIRAGYSDQVEIETSLENVIRFFSDIRNFVEMMPSVESIHTDGGGITHWRIKVDVPFIGSFKQKFTVQLAEETEDRIEWIPAAGEKQNFLRYSAEFMPQSENSTVVQFSQNADLWKRVMQAQIDRENESIATLRDEREYWKQKAKSAT